jgi:cardiolipin synthase
MKSLRMHYWLPMLMMCWGLLGACASLPDVQDLGDRVAPAATMSKLAKRWPQAALEEAATGEPLIAGNKCTLLFDGPQTLAAMLQAIAAARNHINFETYIFDQDELGLKFADALIEKQRQGVTVNILYDSVGTIGVPAEFFKRMRDAGIHLIEFNPVNPAKASGEGWKLNNRDHRKMLIVDGKVGFTGGINISATYAKSSLFRSASRPTDKSQVGWRDTHVKIEGPAVRSMQWLFMRQWTSQGKEELPDADYFPQLVVAGDKAVRVLGSEPGGEFEIYKAYALAIQEAKKSIHITSAYFVPDRQTVDALTAAARRGVDVRIVLPGVSDSGLVFYAGHALYDELLAAGVKIYQLKLAVLHAKTAVIDSTWSTVGSTNIDMRSFLHNSEVNVIVMGTAFGTEMEKAFQEDIRDSNQITLEQWRDRSMVQRMKEWAARFMNYWL